MKSIALFICVFIGLALASLFVWSKWHIAPPEPPLTDAIRDDAKQHGLAHSFVMLSEGKVHFRREGPRNAPTILLIHGFHTPSFVWNDYFLPLTEAGYQVISFDNYGRGLSDRPEGDYTLTRTRTLIEELLDHLGVTRPLHLVGYSMGGVTAADFAVTHPEKARSLTLIAPAGTGTQPLTVSALTWSPLGDILMTEIGPRLSAARMEQAALASTDPDRFRDHWQASAGLDGSGRALLSTLCHYPLWGSEELYRRLEAGKLPVQVIWGEQDSTVPFSEAARLIAALPSAQLHTYKSIGHEITYSHPALVTGHLTDFVESHRLRRVSSGLGGKARSPEGRLDALDCLCHADESNGELQMPNLAGPSPE